MKFMTCTAIAAALVLSTAACKQQESAGNEAAATEAAGDISVLNGTWKTDKDSVKFEQKPDEFALKDGTYNCTTCIPPLTVAADGQFHESPAGPMPTACRSRRPTTRPSRFHSKKGGKEVSSVTMSVSADGNTLTRKFHDGDGELRRSTDRARPRAQVRRPPALMRRRANGRPNQVNDYSEEALSATYTIAGNKVTWAGQGQTYTAELGGPAVAVTGDLGGTTVAVTQEGGTASRRHSPATERS